MTGTARVVFFDAAGTLIAPQEAVGSIYAQIARSFGVEASPEAIEAGFHRAFASAPGLAFGTGRPPAELRRMERLWWRALVMNSFTEINGAGTEASHGCGGLKINEFPDFDAYFDALFEHFADPATWRVYPEVVPVLERLKTVGMRLGVISNFDYRLYRILEGLKLAEYFDSITISSEAGYAKPSPEIFRTALGKHRVEPSTAIHVGDSPELDAAAADSIGMAAVLIDHTQTEPLKVGSRRARISSLAYLPEVAARLKFA